MSSGGGAPVIGGLFQAGGALMESSDKASAYEEQATQLENNAKTERKVGAYNVMRQQIAAGKKFGEIEANYAASGVTQDSGSVMAVMAGSHINSEFDRLSIIHGADMRANIMETRSKQDRSAADRTRQLGYYNAFSSVFFGGAKAAAMGGPDERANGDAQVEADSNANGYGTAGGRRSDDNYYA